MACKSAERRRSIPPPNGLSADPPVDQQGLINALAQLHTEIEAVGVKITTSTYDSWSMKISVTGMLILLGLNIKQRGRNRLADTALQRVVGHLENRRSMPAIQEIIDNLKFHNDDVEKYLNRQVRKVT